MTLVWRKLIQNSRKKDIEVESICTHTSDHRRQKRITDRSILLKICARLGTEIARDQVSIFFVSTDIAVDGRVFAIRGRASWFYFRLLLFRFWPCLFILKMNLRDFRSQFWIFRSVTFTSSCQAIARFTLDFQIALLGELMDNSLCYS